MTVRIAIALDNARLYQLAQKQLAELQTLYDKISYLERLKTDMIRIAAHDLRNPIHLVNTYADLLQQDLGNVLDEQHQQFLQSIVRAGGQMLRITNNILSPERIEQNAKAMQLIDLRKVVEESYLAHRDQARQKRLTYEVALPEESMSVNGDPVQLSEAMANLIVNAIKYTPEGGRILVSLLRNSSRAVVNVEDTGYGIPAEQQEKLFQPFFRANLDEIKHIDGTGLGLHLVKNIVERHFGKVHFKSIRGQGSTFGFELLLAQKD
jgi:signal transduction histidine kinase